MNDSIKKMLRLIDKNLTITEVTYETFQKKNTLIIDAVLSPPPCACKNCGSSVFDAFGKSIVVKNGKKKTMIRFDQYNHMPMVMRLKSNVIPVKTVEATGLLRVILSVPGIPLPIMSDSK